MTKFEELQAAFENSTPGEWKPCRSHEDYGGPYFDIDSNERVEYDARPFTSIKTSTDSVVTAHDLFAFRNQDAHFIALAHNLMPQLLDAIILVSDLVEYAEGATLEGDELPPCVAAAHELLERLK